MKKFEVSEEVISRQITGARLEISVDDDFDAELDSDDAEFDKNEDAYYYIIYENGFPVFENTGFQIKKTKNGIACSYAVAFDQFINEMKNDAPEEYRYLFENKLDLVY